MNHWRRFNGEVLQSSIKDTVRSIILREKSQGNRLKVCIGTDSEVRGKRVEFATVIVFLREKRGGLMLVKNETLRQKMSLKERMLAEVARSIDISYKLCDLLDEQDVALEVHADINTDPQFRSNVALNEAMGYILSMGFAFKAKPNAFASTSCADKAV